MAKRLGVDLRVTRQLLLIGVTCARMQRFEEAERIIRGVKAFRNDVPHPGTALATAFMFQGRLQEAATELEAVLGAFPDHQLGKALLGLVYREVGRGGWQSLLEEVIEDGRDAWAIQLARQSLGFDYQPATTERVEGGQRRESAPLPAPTAYA